MRLKYGELSVAERAERDALQQRARAAWSCLREGDRASAVQLLSEVDERIALELPRSAEGDVVVAELTAYDAGAWPLAELLLAEAPADLGYALSLGRAPVSLAQALDETREAHALDLTRASVRAGFGRGHLLEVTLGVPGGNGSEIEQNAAENLVRALLGDRLFEIWIGAVHVTPAPRGGSLRVLDVNAPRSELTLRELLPTVLAASLGALRGLPEARYRSPSLRAEASAERAAAQAPHVPSVDAASSEDWTLLEIEPMADTSGVRKDDLLLASTCTPELLRCYLDGSPCASRRFSRTEQFVFVSYPDDEPTMQARVARRSAIEAALADCIAGEGAVTGVGLGAKTTYVDLALCNLETGLPRLVSKLRDVRAPVHTFIQFFDTELSDEWLSIWPDSRLTEG